jgi:hypothetical protein
MHLKSDETMSMPVLISLLLLLTACQGSFRAKEGKPIELIETWPVETPMDLPVAYKIWCPGHFALV